VEGCIFNVHLLRYFIIFFIAVRKFVFKILSSGAMSSKKLASVGVQNNTVKYEKLVLRNRMK